MELEALGAISGQVLDAGCGLGDNAIYLAGRGYEVTGFDSSPTAIEQVRTRASDAGVEVRFDVADATELAGFERRFDTVVDSALYHCLSEDDSANINGVTAPMEAVPEAGIRDTLTKAGWCIDFLGPTTFVGNTSGFSGSFGKLPEAVLLQMPPRQAEQMRVASQRMATILPLIESARIHLLCNIIHATRIQQ